MATPEQAADTIEKLLRASPLGIITRPPSALRQVTEHPHEVVSTYTAMLMLALKDRGIIVAIGRNVVAFLWDKDIAQPTS